VVARAPTIAQVTQFKAAKVGRNDHCPCGSGKEIQEVLRALRSGRRCGQPDT